MVLKCYMYTKKLIASLLSTKLTCRSDKLGHAKVHRGKKHNYLGVIIDYSAIGAFKVDVTNYTDTMKENFLHKTSETPKP